MRRCRERAQREREADEERFDVHAFHLLIVREDDTAATTCKRLRQPIG
jgi:putative hemolysin